ncbi:hypothetical protein ACFOW6_01000 [Fodinicurvata halophila]|uniref:Uncharacterized protein n=1 Tax=Fodinicurvata halophila TaxID=1419723 RepID=A0ABV8UHM9_9PROT
MSSGLLPVLLGLTVLGSCLVAGIFVASSTFIMPALERVAPALPICWACSSARSCATFP